MPIKIQSDLPVKEILEQENIFVMDDTRAMHQDIRPIQILILNLMPLKEETATFPHTSQYIANGWHMVSRQLHNERSRFSGEHFCFL